MIIEVAGTSTRNKGAELMLSAIREHYVLAGVDVQIAVRGGFGEFDSRAEYGLRTVLPTGRWGRWRLAGAVMPHAFRKSIGVVAEAEVDAVLDASGFAFGDQLGVERSKGFAADVLRWKRQGKKVVLLPQAFGPFEMSSVRDAFRPVVELADLIYARDMVSFSWLEKLGGSADRLRCAPDFTNLVESKAVGESRSEYIGRSCLVPNYQMIVKGRVAEKSAYVRFLAACFSSMQREGLAPFVLLHDTNVDWRLVAPLEEEVGEKLDILEESDPHILKSLLGASSLVVASRFHALVGALSQAVPAIGAGWSHKYEMLFESYGCEENLFSCEASKETIDEAVARLASQIKRPQMVAGLRCSSMRQRAEVLAMWREVDECIGITTDTQGRECRIGDGLNVRGGISQIAS